MEYLFDHPYITAAIMFALGLGITFLVHIVMAWGKTLQLKYDAETLIDEAKERATELEANEKKRIQSLIDQVKRRSEREMSKIEQSIEKLTSKIKEREEHFEEKISKIEEVASEKQSESDRYDHFVNKKKTRAEKRREKFQLLLKEMVNSLEKKAQTNTAEIREHLKNKILDEQKIEVSKLKQKLEEEATQTSESKAKELLVNAIHRFARPYCPERGIGYLNFDNDAIKERVLGPEAINLRTVEKLVGVELSYDQENNSVNVYGFDPVRREWGRATIEKMMKNNQNWDEAKISQLVEQTKKTLFQKILQDGNRIANELSIEGLDREIKNMMGALRYRYSFTQNQYFHCAEVGFLCGLMGAELGEHIPDAKRAGLLHDIGKAMDHSQEGGHAMIGADFIKRHGEKDHIVHAVRAHHFDETPQTNLAYLVIAADAVSGARPGARRSTAASFTQKVQDLQTIAKSFNGVIDTHVLSAGREIRIYVDGKRHDDQGALKLSKEIAHKIETEMTYPGQIKVTVVREIQAVELAR